MTALLGRVPIDGKVTDPYPFKVLIGKDNLTANGIQLPDVEGAIVSGTATGDWTLSCVRGDVQSITFVFSDGTVRTVPSPAKSTDGSDNKTAAAAASAGCRMSMAFRVWPVSVNQCLHLFTDPVCPVRRDGSGGSNGGRGNDLLHGGD